MSSWSVLLIPSIKLLLKGTFFLTWPFWNHAFRFCRSDQFCLGIATLTAFGSVVLLLSQTWYLLTTLHRCRTASISGARVTQVCQLLVLNFPLEERNSLTARDISYWIMFSFPKCLSENSSSMGISHLQSWQAVFCAEFPCPYIEVLPQAVWNIPQLCKFSVAV